MGSAVAGVGYIEMMGSRYSVLISLVGLSLLLGLMKRMRLRCVRRVIGSSLKIHWFGQSWLEDELGREHLDDLLERGVSGVKVDWGSEVERLQSIIDEMNENG